jgi:hypothetical protein
MPLCSGGGLDAVFDGFTSLASMDDATSVLTLFQRDSMSLGLSAGQMP